MIYFLIIKVVLYCLQLPYSVMNGRALINSVISKKFSNLSFLLLLQSGNLILPSANIVRIRIFSTYKAILTDSLVGS